MNASSPHTMSLDLHSPYALGAEQIARFEHDGFIKLKHVFSATTLAHYGAEIVRATLALNKQTRAMHERSTYERAFLQVMNLWEYNAVVREFVLGRRLARLAAELLRVDGVRLYHDQALFKEPGGGITPAHADQHYWPLASDRTVTAWIPLSAVPLNMGPLGFYPCSQSMAFGRDMNISDHSEAAITQAMRASGIEFCVGAFDLGEVSFHLGWTFHKAGANATSQPRAVMTVIYMDASMHLLQSASPAQQNDADQWCPGAVPGALIDTPKNPVLYGPGAVT